MFKGIRRRFMPSCEKCKWCIFQENKGLWGCNSPKVINYQEKRRCRTIEWAFCDEVRGTRSCKFEPKEVGADI